MPLEDPFSQSVPMLPMSEKDETDISASSLTQGKEEYASKETGENCNCEKWQKVPLLQLYRYQQFNLLCLIQQNSFKN